MLQGLPGQANHVTGLLLLQVNKALGQQGYILGSLPQGRHVNGKDIQAVEQIHAELAGLDLAFQVLVSRRHNAHIGFLGLGAADPLIGALLQDPQQFHLHVEGHVPNLVQEQGATFGHFKTALAGADGTGKSALLVTKQLALKEFRGYGAAVDGNKGASGTG